MPATPRPPTTSVTAARGGRPSRARGSRTRAPGRGAADHRRARARPAARAGPTRSAPARFPPRARRAAARAPRPEARPARTGPAARSRSRGESTQLDEDDAEGERGERRSRASARMPVRSPRLFVGRWPLADGRHERREQDGRGEERGRVQGDHRGRARSSRSGRRRGRCRRRRRAGGPPRGGRWPGPSRFLSLISATTTPWAPRRG